MAWDLFGRNWLTGIICMWSGLIVDIPNGWCLCDGNNGTPDLREKFVRGAQAGHDAGGTGGDTTHIHLVSGWTGWGFGAHTHTIQGDTSPPNLDSAGYASIGGIHAAYELHYHPIYFESQSKSPIHRHTVSIFAGAAGHIPPFYAILFIMKI